MRRRTFLALTSAGLAALRARAALPGSLLSPAGEDFLEDLQRRCFRYFLEHTDPNTGLTLDRATSDGDPYTLDQRPTANITVTGFGLAAFCIAAERGWIGRSEAADKVRIALRFLARRAPHERGWFYHWIHYRLGTRAAAFSTRGELSEVSTVDSAFLLAGILTARSYFGSDREISDLAGEIYRRVDFPWMLEPAAPIFCHGWTPESGFLPYTWSFFSEASILYLLGIGSPTHPVQASSWDAWTRDPNTYGAYRFIGTTPLFSHQYSHAFVDFRGRRDKRGAGTDWFANSVVATRAHRQFCMDLHKTYPGYLSDIWGITCSMSASGYLDWGGPPLDPRTDGTVVPAAPGGSLMFAPDICLPALRAMKERFGDKIYGRYGFTDSFNPTNGWVSANIIGLNLGITLLSMENLRSGKLWSWFMANPEPRRAMDLAGFRPAA
ncbi:MAG: glucoamylase family protein [Opitutaceae bacterium]|jgi:hypothetical protein